ncbi:hypothetical protein NEMBOFW57_005112 [Staphylotrichum longicolle]|uniref:Coenzyme Q-binding protein COQ10 START domain-containing protein n=1 Tax=Staphylotrichum longicolle TaxID=669026 RepID=A0AAD4EX25_9PEZI|nr:hypothetical protein NEMBOFW57_005112 [Staphylotrichum longicolle]
MPPGNLPILRLPPTSSPTPTPTAQPSVLQRSLARSLTTTPQRPWLLSALNNLAPPGTSNNSPPPLKPSAPAASSPTPAQIYTLIADIDSYSAFLPHCTLSRVTKRRRSSSSSSSSRERDQQQQQPPPALADLTVGWGPFTQTYTSRVYCVPGQVVEAVSGAAETGIPRETLRAAGYPVADDDSNGAGQQRQGQKMEGIFESLVTRWTVKPVAREVGGGGGEWTEVALSVTFQFANPALGFAVGQMADVKVDEMVEAFEGRAKELYGGR